MRLFHYWVLMRPANIVTAIADILDGIAIAGLAFDQITDAALPRVLLLILTTIGLYGGGVVLNDFFDRETDARNARFPVAG